MSEVMVDEKIKEAVRQAYGDIARRYVEEPTASSRADRAEAPSRRSCCGPAEAATEGPSQQSCCGPAEVALEEPSQQSCCGPSETSLDATCASRFYSADELTGLPDSVTDASLGCGNPITIADLQPGEVVLDLGSGGGIDCFLAARKVGPEGRVLGLDMTPDMIKLARRNAKKIGATNVDFRFGEMEEMPLPDASVDVILSNCVINLSPDKDAVFREAYRVLRPGGRMSISDIVVDGDLPQAIRSRLDAWAGCIAGALDESIYLGKMREAGFEAVKVASRDFVSADQVMEEDIQALLAGPDGQVIDQEKAKVLLAEAGVAPRDLIQKVASIKVTAHKPA